MDLKSARLRRGLSQVEAAARLGVSQPYLAMVERGQRRLTADLARRAMTLYQLPPTVLPPAAPPAAKVAGADALARDLATLGYPGFAHLRQKRRRARNPAELLLTSLAQESLEARLVEALPWLVVRYWPLDEEWLVREAKVRDLQNRLGFVVTLARRLADRANESDKARALRAFETRLERSRLARQEPLGKAALREPERRWLQKRRPADARRWNLLTDWTVDALRYTG